MGCGTVGQTEQRKPLSDGPFRDQSLRRRGVGWEQVHVCIDDATRVAYVEG